MRMPNVPAVGLHIRTDLTYLIFLQAKELEKVPNWFIFGRF